jgi:hypothetical protein
MVKAMVAYRCGRLRECIEMMPGAGGINPTFSVFPPLFSAMAHWELGNAEQARELLNQARDEIEDRIPTPDGPELPWQDRAVVWCMTQSVLREAEELIEASASHAEAENPQPALAR